MLNLYKKELGYYLNNPVGYITAGLFAVFANYLFVKDIFIISSASLKPLFGVMPWLFLVFIPALAMRTFAEEKRQNTIEILLTLPFSETQIVLSKFFALFTILITSLLLTFAFPVSLTFFTHIYLPEIIIGYIGQLLLGGLILSLSLYCSTLTNNQIVAFIIAALSSFVLLILSTEFLAGFLPRFIQDFVSYYSPLYHLQNFTKGLVDLRSFIYFLSFILVFLFLSIVNLEKRE